MSKKNSSEVDADLYMKGFAIKNMKVTPGGDASATSRKYVDRKIGTKADKTSLASYVKKDSPEVSADLDMRGFAIKNMKITPGGDANATSRKYVDGKLNTKADKNDLNDYLKLDGTLQMQGNLQMNSNRIASLPDPQLSDEAATKKKCFDNNESSSQSFFRPTREIKNVGNTSKYQCHYGSNNTLYYSKTLIRFKKTSSSPPVFVYFTIHYDDKSVDLNTYPKEFKNQIYLVAYGVEELTDHVDSEVYDAHEAFEIDETKMKMLVPLDMNNQKIMNTNFDLKFGDLFKIYKMLCRTTIANSIWNIKKKK